MSAAHDQILGAPGQNQPLIFREVADVPGHEPTVVGQHVDVVSRIDVTRETCGPRTMTKPLVSLEHSAFSREFRRETILVSHTVPGSRRFRRAVGPDRD